MPLPMGGGVITPSVFSSLSLSVCPVAFVESDRGGPTFSAGTFLGSGMLGSRGGAGVWATAADIAKPPSAARTARVVNDFHKGIRSLLLRGATASLGEGSGCNAPVSSPAEGKGIQHNDIAAQRLFVEDKAASLRDSIIPLDPLPFGRG